MTNPMRASDQRPPRPTVRFSVHPLIHRRSDRMIARIFSVPSSPPGETVPGIDAAVGDGKTGHHRGSERSPILIQATLRLGIAAYDALAVADAPASQDDLLRLLGALDIVDGAAHVATRASRSRYRALLARTADAATRDALTRAWEEGRAMPPAMSAITAVNMIVAYLHQQSAMSDPPSGGESRLTPRERQVLNLLIRGMSDREIADRLSISPHTASTHVKRVRAKLGDGHLPGNG